MTTRAGGGFLLPEFPPPVPNRIPFHAQKGTVVSTVIHTARRVPVDAAIWRHCKSCDGLAPLAPDATLCDPCSTAALTAYLDARLGALAEAAKRSDSATAGRVLHRIRTEAPAVLSNSRARCLVHGGGR